MVVVNLSESDEEIVQMLQYWNSFIENHCNQVAVADPGGGGRGAGAPPPRASVLFFLVLLYQR